MKKFITIILLSLIAVVSCKKFDDSKIWDKLNEHENRILLLEELCRKLNADIINLQTIVTALETNDYIINASPLVTGDGYTFLFKSGKSIVVYNGKDGANGKDGVTPQISIKKDTDGVYYWTINGEWLIVDGEKVKARAEDGKNGVDGTNGNNGITPQFKIEDDYWYISYDNGKSWERLGKAKGDSGLNGEDGDNFFCGVSIDDDCIYFILNDGNNTTIKIPYYTEDTLVFVSEKEGDIQEKLTNQQKRSVINLVIEGNIGESDIRYIADKMLTLEVLDVRRTTLLSVPEYAFCKGELKDGKESIREIYLPTSCKAVGRYAFYGCINLRYIEAKGDISFRPFSLAYCDNISLNIGSSTFIGDGNTQVDTLRLCGTSIENIEDVKINHLIVGYEVKQIHNSATGYFEGLTINSVEFGEPSQVTSINMGILQKVSEVTIPTSITKISSSDTYPFAYKMKKITIPKESKLTLWELDSNYLKYLEEIYCYLPTPLQLKYSLNSEKIYPKVYVPAESYSSYVTTSIWSDFDIQPM